MGVYFLYEILNHTFFKKYISVNFITNMAQLNKYIVSKNPVFNKSFSKELIVFSHCYVYFH